METMQIFVQKTAPHKRVYFDLPTICSLNYCLRRKADTFEHIAILYVFANKFGLDHIIKRLNRLSRIYENIGTPFGDDYYKSLYNEIITFVNENYGETAVEFIKQYIL